IRQQIFKDLQYCMLHLGNVQANSIVYDLKSKETRIPSKYRTGDESKPLDLSFERVRTYCLEVLRSSPNIKLESRALIGNDSA
ncbi:12572_t:CDS:2, partial [Funneliformis geosporum]